jgi:hypothetical protein
MGNHRVILPDRKPGGSDLVMWRGRKITETVEAPAYANEAPAFAVVQQRPPPEPAVPGLIHGEVPMLFRGHIEQISMIRLHIYVRHISYITGVTSD